MTDANTAAPPAPGPLAGAGILIVVLVGLIVWTLIFVRFVSPLALFGGYLMLWHWANVEQLSLHRLPAALIGALVGIGIAWFLLFAATTYGGIGLAAGLGVLILAIYLDILKTLPLAVNAATMLYITVAAAPLVQLHVNWGELIATTIGGGLFFAGFVEGIKWLTARFMPAQPG